jgi:hypothetical protein
LNSEDKGQEPKAKKVKTRGFRQLGASNKCARYGIALFMENEKKRFTLSE